MVGKNTAIQEDLQIDGDDLKLIRGIGPALERRFHEAGIQTFSQIAAMTPEELAVYFSDLTGLSAHRIAQADWVGQARQLESKHLPARAVDANNVPEKRLHYAVFTVELLLDSANHVHRTRVLHVQSQNESAWAGWHVERLGQVITRHAGVAFSGQTAGRANEDLMALDDGLGDVGFSQKTVKGEVVVRGLKVKPAMNVEREDIFRSEQPLHISMMMDLSSLQAPRNQAFLYSVLVYAQRIGSASWRLIGSAEGQVNVGESLVELAVEGQGLPGGVYRLEALVRLTQPGDGREPATNLMAMTESGALQVY